MDSSNQTSWPPFQPPQDCSLGFCSIYCPQWCYFLFPPPPSFDPSDSAPAISPLGIALIALAAAAFVLFSYYAIIHRHCRRRRRSSHPIAASAAASADAAQDPSPSDGLDDALISKITVHSYRRGDALVAATNCSVCLCEFRDDDGLRLLPKCNHAFHIPCIDTWLKSHPNCPLCRAGIVWPGPPPAEEAPIQVVIQESQTSSLVGAEQGPVKGIDGVSSSSMNHARGRSGVLPL